MANFKVQHHITLTDADGHPSTFTLTAGPTGDTTTLAAIKTNSDAILAALSPLSNAKVTRRSVSVLIDEAQGVGTDAAYPDVEQKASLTFGNAQGSKATLHIPAPVATIFQAPPVADLVDPANENVAAFISMVEAQAEDAGSHALNLYFGGSLSSRKRARRVSIRATT